MQDFSKEPRENLVELFRVLSRSLERMNQLPHEMVALFISKSGKEDEAYIKGFWAEYLEYLAKLIREASPLYPD